MLTRYFTKTAALAVAALLMAGTLAQAQTGGDAASGAGMGSGMGMHPGSGMSSQADPYAQGPVRRSRASVVPNIANDSVYPDPNNPGRDDPTLKARRDAKRAARSGNYGTGESAPVDGMGSSYSSPVRSAP